MVLVVGILISSFICPDLTYAVNRVLTDSNQSSILLDFLVEILPVCPDVNIVVDWA